MFESSGIPGVTSEFPGDSSSAATESIGDHRRGADALLPVTCKKSHGTFELKFLIEEERTRLIMDWATQHLGPDPHMDPEVGEGYLVNSLYLDTPEFDVFHRMPGHRRRKFRLRRYGRESLIYFEQKHKRQGLVRKKRVGVPESDVDRRLQSDPDLEWHGDWFRKRIDEHLLRPVCQVVYQRFVRVTSTEAGPLRLTIDSHLKGRPCPEWRVPAADMDGVSLLDGKQILELKFRGAMPPLFRKLIDDHQLLLTSFSKYRRSVEQCLSLTPGQPPSDQEQSHA